MRIRHVAIASVLLFSLASCGGDNSSDVSDAIEEAITEGGDASDMGGDTNIDLEDTGNSCMNASLAMGSAYAAFSVAIMDPSQFNIEEYRANMAKARELVSDEIRPDFDLMASAYDSAAEAFVSAQEAGGITSAAGMAKLEEAGAVFDDQKVQDAANRVGNYFVEECIEIYGQ